MTTPRGPPEDRARSERTRGSWRWSRDARPNQRASGARRGPEPAAEGCRDRGADRCACPATPSTGAAGSGSRGPTHRRRWRRGDRGGAGHPGARFLLPAGRGRRATRTSACTERNTPASSWRYTLIGQVSLRRSGVSAANPARRRATLGRRFESCATAARSSSASGPSPGNRPSAASTVAAGCLEK